MHQVSNFLRFCELAVKIGDAKEIHLLTGSDDEKQKAEAEEKFNILKASLADLGVVLSVTFSPTIHDREVRLDNGWKIKIGRGFDIYQKPDSWFEIGASNFALRPCLETKVDIFRE